MAVLKEGQRGAAVEHLQRALKEHGFDPGKADGVFGGGTEAAVLAFQKSEGLAADGIAGANTLAKLGIGSAPSDGAADDRVDITADVTVAQVSKMCAHAPLGNINKYLGDVLRALRNQTLGDKAMVLMAIATIRAETGSFEPLSEFRSRYNSSPSGHPFDLYDSRKDLGNRGQPDGALFKGRGFVQLTGRANYAHFGAKLGIGTQLVDTPELANDAKIAADLLALFLTDKETRIRAALRDGDLAAARKAVNGGHHGLAEFSEAYKIGDAILS